MRDPCIKKHSVKKLLWFAGAFDEMAADHRKEAANLEAKALRYRKRAAKMEKDND